MNNLGPWAISSGPKLTAAALSFFPYLKIKRKKQNYEEL